MLYDSIMLSINAEISTFIDAVVIDNIFGKSLYQLMVVSSTVVSYNTEISTHDAII